MKLVANCEVFYDGRTRQPGDEFDADDRDITNINILKGLGKVRDAVPKPAARATPKPQAPIVPKSATDQPPETQPSMLSEPGEPAHSDQHRRRYRRRDLQAEE